jgi:hypothetical protein
MALVDFDTQAEYDGVYKIRIRDPAHAKFGQKLSYTREAMARSKGPYDDNMTAYQERFDNLTALFSMATGDRIIFAGCGLGFTIEPFIDAGFTEIWGLDSSSYIDSIKATEARGDVEIIDEEFKNSGQLNAKLIAVTGGNNFKWIITESILEGYENGDDMDDILDAAEVGLTNGEPLDQIIHMVYPSPGVGLQFNQNTLAQWKAIRPAHSFVDYVRWIVAT